MNRPYKSMPSPIGELKLVAGSAGLTAIVWKYDDPRRVRLDSLVEDPAHPILVRTEKELTEYFRGERRSFTVPLEMRGTHFQKQVWNALLGIPYGQTRTYGEIANQLGNPNATRAVGAANGRNPVAIIVPCHRLIGSDGKLTGFAGGLEAKAHLLELEFRRSANGGVYGSPNCPKSSRNRGLPFNDCHLGSTRREISSKQRS